MVHSQWLSRFVDLIQRSGSILSCSCCGCGNDLNNISRKRSMCLVIRYGSTHLLRIIRPHPQASGDRETSCSRLQIERFAMSNIGSPTNVQRDTVVACRARAAADRLSAAAADTRNARSKFDFSASRWDDRADLLGRLDASFAKRERLDAARKAFNGVGSSKRFEGAPAPSQVRQLTTLSSWEGEGGSVVQPAPFERRGRS